MPRRPLISGERADQVAAAYRAGASIRQLTDRFSVSYSAMQRFLSRRPDVTLRPKGRPDGLARTQLRRAAQA